MTTRLAFFNWLRNANGDFNERSNDTWMGLSINDFFLIHPKINGWEMCLIKLHLSFFYFERKSFKVAHRR